jgi:hypothetical protein
MLYSTPAQVKAVRERRSQPVFYTTDKWKSVRDAMDAREEASEESATEMVKQTRPSAFLPPFSVLPGTEPDLCEHESAVSRRLWKFDNNPVRTAWHQRNDDRDSKPLDLPSIE